MSHIILGPENIHCLSNIMYNSFCRNMCVVIWIDCILLNFVSRQFLRVSDQFWVCADFASEQLLDVIRSTAGIASWRSSKQRTVRKPNCMVRRDVTRSCYLMIRREMVQPVPPNTSLATASQGSCHISMALCEWDCQPPSSGVLRHGSTGKDLTKC